MRTGRGSKWIAVMAGALLLAPTGCGVALDALNPAFFAGLGFDPGTIFPPAGVVIVSFTNNTGNDATLYAFESRATILEEYSRGARNFFIQADAGESRNEVIDCPVGTISFGSLDASFAPDDLAIVVADGEVTYEGAPLINGSDFQCGDLIDVQLYAGGATGYLMVVQVIRG